GGGGGGAGEEEGGEEEGQEGDGGDPAKKKVIRRRLQQSYVEQNVRSLNMKKTELGTEYDPMFYSLFEDRGASALSSSLLSHIKLFPGGVLAIDSNDRYADHIPQHAAAVVSATPSSSEQPLAVQDDGMPALKSTEETNPTLSDDVPDEETQAQEQETQFHDKGQDNLQDNLQEFDMNALLYSTVDFFGTMEYPGLICSVFTDFKFGGWTPDQPAVEYPDLSLLEDFTAPPAAISAPVLTRPAERPVSSSQASCSHDQNLGAAHLEGLDDGDDGHDDDELPAFQQADVGGGDDFDFIGGQDDNEMDNIDVPEPDYNLILREEAHQTTLQLGQMLSQAVTLDIDRFDQRFAKNWAGPSHWKFFPAGLSNKRKAPEASSLGDGETEPKPKTRVRREPFRIDFLASPVPSKEFKEALEAKICISQASLDKCQPTDNLLPPDQRYSLRNLLSFFARPEWTVRELAGPAASSSSASSSESSFIAEPCPALHKLNQSLTLASAELPGETGAFGYHYPTAEEDQRAEAVADQAAFDDYDDDGYDDAPYAPPRALDMTFGQHQALPDDRYQAMSALSQNLRLIDDAEWRPRRTGMALNALQSTLNVKQLKSDIWSELKAKLEEPSVANPSSAPASGSAPVPDDRPESTNNFQDLLQRIPDRVEKVEQLAQVSVPFCFICLLHLANEKTLELHQDQGSLDSMLSSLTISYQA
ncbi:MAG: hypothetical protein Q8P67_18875, partial [archaeon]|nr:hypothetical protein [archaeon]